MKAFIFIIALLLFSIFVSTSFAASEDKVELVINVIDGIRNPVPYSGYIEITFLGNSTESIFLKEIGVDWGNKDIRRITLNKTLIGIGSEYQEVHAISSSKNILSASNIPELTARISKGIYREKITIDPNKIFNDGFVPNNEKIINIKIFYIYNNEHKVIHDKLKLKILPKITEPKVRTNQRISIANVPLQMSNYYYGDLHVHTGYSSWVGGYDGDPLTADNCLLELTSVNGPTIPDLRDQAIAQGLNWLSITDHSYCLDTNSFNNVQDWSLGNSTSDFIIVPSEELSVDDIPDDGSDGEPFCFLPNDDNIAHLGAHGISSFIQGGMCNEQINAQQGIDEVKRVGGIPIINHPYGGDFGYWQVDAWDWEANLSTRGETGVEIWNGNTSDQASINFWVSRLLRGLKTYAFSGTDNHSAASDEVVNGVYISGSFNKINLLEALNKGHVFVSNGPFLSLKSRFDNSIMGDTVTVDLGNATEFSVILNPQSRGKLTIHKGVIGESIEDTEVGWPKTYDNLDAGETIFSDTPTKNSYYRAEYRATDGSGYSAYTNPIWVKVEIHGLHASYYNEPIYRNDVNTIATPTVERIDSHIDFDWHSFGRNDPLPSGIYDDGWWSADWAGYIYIPSDGTYSFKLNSDDGSWLFIDGQLVVNNGGDHGPREAFGSITLTKGYYSITVKFFESFGGSANINLYWKPPNVPDYIILPQSALYISPPAAYSSNMRVSKNAPVGMDHGNTMNYTLYFNNFGSMKASNVILKDTLPPDVEFLSASDDGIYNSATRNVTWIIGSVAAFPSGKGTRSVTVRILSSVPVGTVIQNTASISTSTAETKYDDNSASASTIVTGSSLPPDVSVGPTTGNTGGTPSVYWGTPVTLTYYSSCATNVGIIIHVNDGGSDITGSMQETSTDTWTYTTTFYPRHGAATVVYNISGCYNPSVAFNLYIDPAGYIYDAYTGARISGASVWLQRPDGSGGWENVPTGQIPPIAQPDVNPLITGVDGQYHWDVLEGSYRVHVEATGYYPADSIVVSIPPPVTDLHVGLTHIPDITPPTTTASLFGSTGNNDWYTSDVQVAFTATDNPDGSGVTKTEYGFDNTSWTTYVVPIIVNTEGTTAIYYRSIDNAGNVESAKTQTVKIDKTPPSINISGVTDGYYNSDVTPVIAIADTNLNTQPTTLNGAAYTSGTVISAEGNYTLVASATDMAGNTASKTVNFVIDKTAPEAAIRFDTVSKDIRVYDNETGNEANHAVLPSKNDNDGMEEPDDEKGWELRQYTLKDLANNSLVLVLKHKKEGKEAKVNVISTQYNGGAVINASKNKIQAEYAEDKNSMLKELEQKSEVIKQFDAKAKYSSKKDETEINVKLEGQEVLKESRAGIIILELFTDKGSLKLWY